ncbi:polyprenol monophosphomannose synthase [bacterium]|nr:polyprenol monophosphomannose synthase [bacterium]
MADTNTIVMVATYNEAENIRLLVEAILGLGVGVDLLVVDDNSPDGTGAIADELAAEHAEVHVLHRAGKLGLGTATLAGMGYAREHGYDFVVGMDADFSHDPKYLPDLLARRDESDVVIGSRYVPGGGVRDWGRVRRFMSWGANAFVRTVLGLRARDCSGAYRCYRVALLEGIEPASVLARGYAFQEEILYRCQLLGARITEAPIVFVDRQRGETKMSFREIGGLFITVLRLRWRRLTGRLDARAADKSSTQE